MSALPRSRPSDWLGAVLQHMGLLALAGALGTLIWQAVLWWTEGGWPGFPLADIWSAMGWDFPDLRWPGGEQALIWLADKPLSAVLAGLGAGLLVLGRGISAE
ncbi:MAG: hypothetical protein ACP5NP_03500 [Acetobacteraceae bacterium]